MKPNILILVVDSFRADRCFGDNRTCKTPNIDSLIKNGIYFTQAISSSDVTGICLGNMFTGMYSFKTGITLRNFNSKVMTYFDVLKNNGYHLYATIPDLTWFHHLTQNFHEKDTFYAASRVQDDLFSKVGQQIINRLNSKSMQEPWLYYIHLVDLHDEIIVPKNFENEKYGQTKYDQMVSVIDYWLGKILEKIDLQKTLVVITADHGEFIRAVENVGSIPRVQGVMRKGKQLMPFLEPIGLKLFIFIRNSIKFFQLKKLRKKLTVEQIRTLTPRGYNILYNDYLHTPLLFVGSGITSNRIINDLVSSVDIFPTITKLLGIDYNDRNLDGRNLLPLFASKKLGEVPVYIESGDAGENKVGIVIGMRTTRYKYLRNRNDATKDVTLFDLQTDPMEHNNIAKLKPDIINTMEKTLSEITSNSLKKDEYEELSQEETKKIENELKRLGYM